MNYRFASVGLFLILFWLEVSTLGLTAPTADEPMYITRGFAVVQRGRDRLP